MSAPAMNNIDLALGKALRQSIVEATCHVLKAQASLQVEFVEEKIYDPSQFKESIGVAATIGIVGDLVKGGAALAFPPQTFLAIANNLLGESYKEITVENRDLCGEFLNMIFGAVKTKFTDGFKIPFHRAIPMVMQGNDLHFSFDAKTPSYVTAFKSEMGPLFTVTTLSQLGPTKA